VDLLQLGITNTKQKCKCDFWLRALLFRHFLSSEDTYLAQRIFPKQNEAALVRLVDEWPPLSREVLDSELGTALRVVVIHDATVHSHGYSCALLRATRWRLCPNGSDTSRIFRSFLHRTAFCNAIGWFDDEGATLVCTMSTVPVY
jgi:hypothetical protein